MDDNKVWVVSEGSCENMSCCFYGVFSTKEKAEKFINDNKHKGSPLYMGDAYAEEFKLDEVR